MVLSAESACCAVVALVACAGCIDLGSPPPPPTEVIAEPRDFAGFRRWTRFEIEPGMRSTGGFEDAAWVFVRELPPSGADRFPIGTTIVKAFEDPPAVMTLYAMVKREALFNPTGAVGWEFFELRMDGPDSVTIEWRGEGRHGYGERPFDGGVQPLVCHDCHGGAWMNDYVLTPQIHL